MYPRTYNTRTYTCIHLFILRYLRTLYIYVHTIHVYTLPLRIHKLIDVCCTHYTEWRCYYRLHYILLAVHTLYNIVIGSRPTSSMGERPRHSFANADGVQLRGDKGRARRRSTLSASSHASVYQVCLVWFLLWLVFVPNLLILDVQFGCIYAIGLQTRNILTFKCIEYHKLAAFMNV